MRPLRNLVRRKPRALLATGSDSGGGDSLMWRGRLPGSGWYMLELQAAADAGYSGVYLQLDYGAGYEAGDNLFLALRRGRVAKRICYFPSRAIAVRLVLQRQTADDEDSPCPPEQSIEHCVLAWLAPHFARDRLAQRLANMHFRYRNLSRHAVLKRLKQEARSHHVPVRELALARYAETFHKRTAENGYQEWLQQVERPFLPGDDVVAAEIAGWSITSETGQPAPQLQLFVQLDRADDGILLLRSLLAQSYPHWQLTIAAAPDGGYPGAIAEQAASDTRCLLVSSLEEIGEVTGADFFCKLPADGILSRHALFFVARAIRENPEALVVYSDEDRLDAAGGRCQPRFKPGWNPDWLLSSDYVGDLCFFSGRLALGAKQMSPAQPNYARLLAARTRLSDEQVVSISQVLVHRPEGAVPVGSDAAVVSESMYAGSMPVQVIDGALPGTRRVQWLVPTPAPLVSLLIPTRDGVAFLRQCVASIQNHTDYPNFEILILDNGSRCPETLQYLTDVVQDKRVSVHKWDKPFNYSAINNFGAKRARGELLGLINNDIEVISPGWLTEMVSQALRPEIGCVGAKLYYGNDTLQHGGVILGIGGAAGHSHKYSRRGDPGYMGRLQVVQNLSAVTGACLLVRRSVFFEVGGLNERDLAVAYNDVDFCLKVRAVGYRNLWTPYAEMYHHESLSRGADDTAAKRRRAQREAAYLRESWGALLDNDPAYNRNLTLVYEDFSLR